MDSMKKEYMILTCTIMNNQDYDFYLIKVLSLISPYMPTFSPLVTVPIIINLNKFMYLLNGTICFLPVMKL